MKALVLAFVVVLAFTAIAAPAAEAAPPNLPPGSTGCDYFHWHNGNVQQGTLPGYHYHPCILGP